MRHPAAVVTVGSSALLVAAHAFQRPLVGLGIILDGNECAHAANSGRIAAMAGFHQKLGISIHEWHPHGDQAPVGEAEGFVVPELLDRREDVVPAPCVQTCRMLLELVQNLIHLEGGGNRLDEHGRLDRAARDRQLILCPAENIVPQPGLQVRLHLR